jgi:hypothetical protein
MQLEGLDKLVKYNDLMGIVVKVSGQKVELKSTVLSFPWTDPGETRRNRTFI